MADVAQAEDADHPLALVDYRQPADLERLHMPHCLGEVIVMMNARRFMCGWPPPGKRSFGVQRRGRLQSCVRPVGAVRVDCWP